MRELGGVNGCRAILEQHPELFANAGFVLNEGGYNETIVDYVTFWGIEVQAKVPLWLRITMKGMSGPRGPRRRMTAGRSASSFARSMPSAAFRRRIA